MLSCVLGKCEGRLGWLQLDAAAVDEELSEEKLCVICLVNRRDTTVLPCRHLCMCQDCAQARITRLLECNAYLQIHLH